MMKMQLDQIEADFKVLQSEFKKKNPQIRESVEIGLAWLAQLKQSQNNPMEKISTQPVEILEPLRLMFEQKISKTYPMAMNLLQKITQVFSLTEHRALLLVLGTLKEASSEILDEMTEIRILQMLLTFLDPHTIQLSKEFVTLVMQSCFQMMDTKSLAVKSTIQATLKQLFTIILERFVEECKAAIPIQKRRDIFSNTKHGVQFTPDEVAEISDLLRVKFQGGDSIYIIVKEIVQNLAFTVLMFENRSSSSAKRSTPSGQAQGASEQSLSFKSSSYSRGVVLDLINLCLTTTNEVFRFFPEVNSIFELQIAPTIEPLLSQKSATSSIGMRLMKCATLIINNLGVSLNLLRSILTDATAFTSRSRDGTVSINLNWKSLIAFECLQIVISNPGLSELFATSSLAIGAPVLIQILECYIQASRAIESSNDPTTSSGFAAGRQPQKGLYQGSQKIPKVINSQNLEGEISPPTAMQIQRIIIESICTFANNFVYVFSAIGIKLGAQSESRGRNRDAEESPSLAKCKRMLTLCWKPLLETLQKLLKTTPDESNIHMLLRAYQSCIGACGSANCYEARDSFLQSLCNECLTPQSGSPLSGGPQNSAQKEAQTGRKSTVSAVNVKPTSLTDEAMIITERNVIICKAFFNISHCLCHVLDVKSWYLILETMQKIEQVIHKKLQVNGLVRQKDRPALNQDGNQLIINFDELKRKVEDKMHQFNIVERSENQKKPGHHSRLSISGSGTITNASRSSALVGNNDESMVVVDDSPVSSHHINLPSLQVGISSAYKAGSASQVNPFEEIRPDQGRSADPMLTDLHMLLESFDSLFTSTLLFDMQSLSELICALGQLTVGVLENISPPTFATSSQRTSTESEILAQINTFAMSRLVETALVNVTRIDDFWKIIVAHFDILSNCQVLAVRLLTIDALQTIILAIFAQKKSNQTQLSQAKHKKLEKARSQAPTESDDPFMSAADLKKNNSQLLEASIENIDSEGNLEEKLGDMASEVASETDSQDVSVTSAEESKASSRKRSGRGADESWGDSTWQYTILMPLSDQLKSSHTADKGAVIKGFEKIIQTCGQQIKNEGWRIIITTISKSLEYESDAVVVGGFRCLKLVVSNYINRLSQANFVTVLNAIHMYANNPGSNINNNLIAIGMFQNVADYTAKQITQTTTQDNLSVKSSSINYEKIWNILFERIQSLGTNKRAEVRKTTVHTLENIVMTHGASFQTTWSKVLNDTVLGMLKNAVGRYTQSVAGAANQRDSVASIAKTNSVPAGDAMVAPTPTFFGSSAQSQGKAQPKMQFDDATVTKALRQNDSQWEESCTVLVQTACRSLKKFFAVTRERQQIEGGDRTQVWEQAAEFWSELTDSMNLMVSVGSSEVCVLIFKALLNFLGDPDCLKLFLKCEDESRTFMQGVIDYLGQEIESMQSSKLDRQKTIKLLKICPIVIETLQKLYNKQTLQMVDQSDRGTSSCDRVLSKLVDKDQCETILHLVSMILSTSKAAENLQSFGTNKLLTEERGVFDFIESLSDFCALKEDTQMLFVEFLLKFTEYSTDARQEAFIKRAFGALYSILLKGAIRKSILQSLMPRLLDRMKQLIDLRYDSQACVQLVFQAKGQPTLFLTMGLYLIHITSFMVNPEQFKARLVLNNGSSDATGIPGQSAKKPSQADKSGEPGQGTGGTGPQRQIPGQATASTANMIIQSSMTNERDLLFSEQPEFQSLPAAEIRPDAYAGIDTKALVWQRIIELLQSTLLFDNSRVVDHNKAVLQEVAKQSQELDMQVMNFILNCLLPNSAMAQGNNSETQKVLEQSLVNIIDRGCSNSTGFGTQSSFSTAAGGRGDNLSRYCFTNMFELCRYVPPIDAVSPTVLQDNSQADSIKEIKLKIARIATPILINRCKQTLKKFISDEKTVGSVGMSKSRISEVVFILDKLRDLDCYPQAQTSAQQSQHQRQSNLSGNSRAEREPTGQTWKKAHLIEIMPVLSDLILRNELAIKESLRLIFLEISTTLNENMLAVANAAAQSDFNPASELENRVSTGAAEDGNRGSSGGEGE